MTETQKRLIESAERIFAEKGYHGTSVRDITNAASANVAAVNYHFGSKEGLFFEMIRYRVEPVNKLRLELLDQALEESGGTPLPVRRLVEIIVDPLVHNFLSKAAKPDNDFLKALGRGMSEENSFMQKLKKNVFAEIIDRFQSELGRTLSDMPKHIHELCFTYMVSTINAIIQIRTRKQHCSNDESDDSYGTYIASFITGGINSIVYDYRNAPK